MGDNYIVHGWSGKIEKFTIDYVISRGYPYRGWGWHGNVALSTGTHTCNQSGGFAYFLKSHPHHDCYKCSVCGTITPNTSTSRYYESCDACHATIPEGVYYLKNQATGTYLDVDNAVDANKTNIHVSQYSDWSVSKLAQQYTIRSTPTPGGYMMMPACSSSRVVNVYGDTVASGNNVCLWDNTSHSSQRWRFQEVSGGYIIRNLQVPNCVLDVDENGNVCVCNYHGGASQIWKIQNVITYDANGGSGAPSEQFKEYGKSLTLSSTKPTRSGYTFLGWSTSSTATTATYQAGGSFTVNANTTLYAVWAVADTVAPVISNVEVTDINPTGYTIVCTVSDNVGVVRVAFPTWTSAGGQDDIYWVDGARNGSTVTFRMDIGNHNNEIGVYKTHIYAYDAAGNYSNYCDIELLVETITTPRYTASFNGHVYAVYDVNSSWTTAKVYCEKMGGHLVTINSQEEQSFLEQYVGDRFYWIGASDSQKEGDFQWVTGETWGYSNWAEEQPDDYQGRQEYVCLNYLDGQWDDEFNVKNEWRNAGFILEIEPLTPSNTIVYNGHKYDFYDVPLGWTEAKVYCEMIGGYLATITYQEEQNAIMSVGSLERSYWLGATDQNTEGMWEWITGEPWGYTNWNTDEPNDEYGCEDWVGLLNSGRWNDYENNFFIDSHGFLCESVLETLGDINADGTVNMRDALVLYQAVSAKTTLTETQQALADINGDGAVNMRDVLMLYQQISG